MGTARLHAILARNAPLGVVFRRGPSKQVRLIQWNLADDTFEMGQWFKGRIYERRCDLSPGGTLLIYFAANYKKPLRAWTAISKPPWLTALALWPKGDCWNGGGHFVSQYSICLNHPPDKASPHPDFVSGCRKISIASYGQYRGEDDTVWEATLERDGWNLVQRGKWGKYGATKGVAWKALAPEIWRKPHPSKPFVLQMAIEGIGKRDGSWLTLRYRILDKALNAVSDLGETDWADWDHQRDLVFAKNGCLYRHKHFFKRNADEAILIADFNNQKFEAMEAPEWARKL